MIKMGNLMVSEKLHIAYFVNLKLVALTVE